MNNIQDPRKLRELFTSPEFKSAIESNNFEEAIRHFYSLIHGSVRYLRDQQDIPDDHVNVLMSNAFKQPFLAASLGVNRGDHFEIFLRPFTQGERLLAKLYFDGRFEASYPEREFSSRPDPERRISQEQMRSLILQLGYIPNE